MPCWVSGFSRCSTQRIRARRAAFSHRHRRDDDVLYSDPADDVVLPYAVHDRHSGLRPRHRLGRPGAGRSHRELGGIVQAVVAACRAGFRDFRAARRNASELGAPRFLIGIVVMTTFYILILPMMWFCHTLFMIGILGFGRAIGWAGQVRDDHTVSWAESFKQLWPHAVLGFGIFALLDATHPSSARRVFSSASS